MLGVFVHRDDSKYDDHPSRRYQFPSNYLSRAAAIAGGWVLYYEPTKVPNSRGYYAVARVEKIVDDPVHEDMHLALIEPGSYYEFAEPVPFRESDGLLERGLYNRDGKISGRAQASVRPISKVDFERILDRGLRDYDETLPRVDSKKRQSVEEDSFDFEHPEGRSRKSYESNRIIRDPMFRRLILNAYNETCAFTGLRLINGGGRAEVQAAHIRPVEENGPDSVRNGIALSGTVHWMFDRGLLSVADNMEIMVSRHLNNPAAIEKLIHKSFVARVPEDDRTSPHPSFLEWHRENRFKA